MGHTRKQKLPRYMLQSLELCREMGNIPGMLYCFQTWEEYIQKVSDPKSLYELSNLKHYFRCGNYLESILGKNIMLNLDHQLVSQWLDSGIMSNGMHQEIQDKQRLYFGHHLNPTPLPPDALPIAGFFDSASLATVMMDSANLVETPSETAPANA